MLKKWFGRDKRKEQRTQIEPPSLDSFSIYLELADQEFLDCKVRNISVNSASVSYTGEQCPDFDPGDKVKLTVTVAHLQETIPLTALVKECTPGQKTTRMSFDFEDSYRFKALLDPSHLSFLNSRQSYRVEIADIRHHTEVALSWDGGSAARWINDLSLSGMGLGVESRVAQQLSDTDRLELTFSLRGCESMLRLTGRVRYQLPDGNNFHCGIMFDQHPDTDFQQQEKVIAAYLTRLQQERKS